jgi:hypothetical protein
MSKVHASRTCVVTHNGVPVLVREDEGFDQGDPLVAAFPWLFADVVEEATARPGERRTTRRKSS